jgi:aminopeptidase YwaD
MTEEEGARLLPHAGETVTLRSQSQRIPGQGYNVAARRGPAAEARIVVTAHIDAKKGTPGAIDNATGVAVLLLLGELLKDTQAPVEIVAFNGEDYYAVPGQMLFVQQNFERFDAIRLNINIDGAGYREGPSAFSFYGLPAALEARARTVFSQFAGLTEGVQWVQGDHSLFTQFGRPAIALSSAWFTEHVDSQEITHTPQDRIEIVDCGKVVEIAQALAALVEAIGTLEVTD